MPFPLLARKAKRFASQHILQLKHLLGGRGFFKFKRLYRLKGELGHGGFGIVYRAVRISDQLPVAVKFIERRNVREWGKLDDHKVPMEVALLARCSNIAGVIALIDWFSLPEGFLIVMERPMPCMDLFDFIHRQKTLDENVAKFLFRPIVRAVVELAERKVLHRDLKDENILINLANGQIKLIDFGAATLFTRNRCNDFQGTRLYCPPEWFLHSLYLGREATVWSLGVLLFNMLNGRLPFLNEKDICTAHLLGPLPFFATLSQAVRDLLAQCLSFEASCRPSLHQMLAHPWLNNEMSSSSAATDWTQLSVCCSQMIDANNKLEETEQCQRPAAVTAAAATAGGHGDERRRRSDEGTETEATSRLALSFDECRGRGDERVHRHGQQQQQQCGTPFYRQRRYRPHSAQQQMAAAFHPSSHTTTALCPSTSSSSAQPQMNFQLAQATETEDHQSIGQRRHNRDKSAKVLEEYNSPQSAASATEDGSELNGPKWQRRRQRVQQQRRQQDNNAASFDSDTASSQHCSPPAPLPQLALLQQNMECVASAEQARDTYQQTTRKKLLAACK